MALFHKYFVVMKYIWICKFWFWAKALYITDIIADWDRRWILFRGDYSVSVVKGLQTVEVL